VGFIVLSRPIILGLFGGGRFDNYSAKLTADALLFYSIGLTAYGTTKILQSCFFALKDTVTPAKVSAISLCMNIVLNAALMFPMRLSGLALATSISGIVTTFILYHRLQKKLHAFDGKEILASFVRIFVASVAMGAICFGLASHNIIIGNHTFAKLLQLGFLLVVGCISYAVFCFLFRVREMRELWAWVKKSKLKA
jgi:putative peptidoglycan lipid II flippase